MGKRGDFLRFSQRYSKNDRSQYKILRWDNAFSDLLTHCQYCKPRLPTYKTDYQWRSVHLAAHVSLHGQSRTAMASQTMPRLTQAGKLSLPSEETFNLPISLPLDIFKR